MPRITPALRNGRTWRRERALEGSRMANAEATHLTAASAALLTAATNLSKFHRLHEEFYASSPREQAVLVQRHGRTLQSLADRWSTAIVDHRSPFNPYEGAEDLNAEVALQLDGVLFMEGENEPVEITRLKRDLRTVGEDSRATSAWLASAMEMSWEIGTALLEIPQLASVLGDRHRIIANDWHAAHLSALAGNALLRAVQI